MAPLYRPVASLKELQKLVREHGEVEGFRVCFTGELEMLSEAKGMLRLLEKMEEESGWKIEVDGLPRLVDIDDALDRTNWILVRMLAIDGFATLDVSTAPPSLRGDSTTLSTDMASPDYGTIQFSRRLGMEFLRGRRGSRFEDGSGTKPGRRSVSIGRRHVENTRARSADASTDRVLGDTSSGRGASTDRVLADTSSGCRVPAAPVTVVATPGRRAPSAPASTKRLTVDVSPGPSRLLPVLRFMPPAVAVLVQDAGRNLMQMPLQSVRTLGCSVEMLGRRLKDDVEAVEHLREAVKSVREQLIQVWNAGADAGDFLY